MSLVAPGALFCGCFLLKVFVAGCCPNHAISSKTAKGKVVLWVYSAYRLIFLPEIQPWMLQYECFFRSKVVQQQSDNKSLSFKEIKSNMYPMDMSVLVEWISSTFVYMFSRFKGHYMPLPVTCPPMAFRWWTLPAMPAAPS
jgi:hypothetical protein